MLPAQHHTRARLRARSRAPHGEINSPFHNVSTPPLLTSLFDKHVIGVVAVSEQTHAHAFRSIFRNCVFVCVRPQRVFWPVGSQALRGGSNYGEWTLTPVRSLARAAIQRTSSELSPARARHKSRHLVGPDSRRADGLACVPAIWPIACN